MRMIILTFITGILAAVLMSVNIVMQKRRGGKLQKGAAGIILVVSYLAGHILLSGIPPLLDRGLNMPTDQWNFFIAAAALVPLLIIEYTGISRVIKHVMRFLFAMFAAFLVLQVPYIQTTWSLFQSLAVLTAVSVAAVAGLNEADSMAGHDDSRMVVTTLLSLSFTVTVILGISSTLALSLLSAQVLAAATAMVVIYLIAGKLSAIKPEINYSEVIGFIYIISLFFLVEGYFFADVPLMSIGLVVLSIFFHRIIYRFITVKFDQKNRMAVMLTIPGVQVCNILALAVAGSVNL